MGNERDHQMENERASEQPVAQVNELRAFPTFPAD